jgi:hypothetical protein
LRHWRTPVCVGASVASRRGKRCKSVSLLDVIPSVERPSSASTFIRQFEPWDSLKHLGLTAFPVFLFAIQQLHAIKIRASRRAGWQQDRNGEKSMVRIAVLGLSLIVVNAARAQDMAGIEDCTKTSGLDKRTGEARNKLDDAASEIVALKGIVTRLQKTVEQLQAAQKAVGDKKRNALQLCSNAGHYRSRLA